MDTQFIHKALLQMRGVSPTALTVVGIVGIVTATIMSSRATLKLKPVLEEIEVGLDVVNENKLVIEGGFRVYSDNEIAIQKVKVVTHGAWDLAILYGPAVIVGVVSIGAIAGGHGILLKRNAALAGALTITEKAFDNYRKAVAKEIGEEREKEIRYNKQVELVSDTEAGTATEVATVSLESSPYARFFDEFNPNWDRASASYNRMFLTAQQEYANQKLQRQGWLLLNDVYHELGFEKTSAGAVVGWALGHGDEYIDFGMYDFTGKHGERRQAFQEGDEKAVLLDFNVAGVVYNMIGDKH